ncbi:hypothetical protein LSTR_LSTR010989 [Laodelphax striatellus]|uniref:HECT-type E3 ubiquitin transferase n=1 Tax=Laodelphax striatellus TaxID=195883 RepID=A0A482X403_LAOST|nr:hypothetical protein LSTR_LSTR010989 [Laodelphax striatellus]
MSLHAADILVHHRNVVQNVVGENGTKCRLESLKRRWTRMSLVHFCMIPFLTVVSCRLHISTGSGRTDSVEVGTGTLEKDSTMSNEELVAKILQRAVQLDKDNRLTEANVYYLEALSLLMEICRETQDEEKKKYLRSKMDVYMRRAETLKKHINDEKSKGTYHEVLRIENDSIGHSYDSVFGRFLNKDVTSIVVQDPYVLAFHQCQNFLQACELFVKKCENLKQINLLTGEDSSENQKQWLEQLRASLLSKHDICLNVKYSSTLHDRQILLNNGWIIKIGRGLDYFKAVDNKFSIGSHDYDLRPCFETNVDIFHKKNVQFKNSRKFRTAPEQNLAGASRKEGRNELLQRAHLERMKREESRQRQNSAVRIQSVIRRFLCRQKYYAVERQEFDNIVKHVGSNVPDESTFTVLIQKLLFFYQKSLDGARLLWISNHTLRHYTRLLITVNQPESQIWRWRLSKLLHLNLNFLVDQSSSRESLATPLRLFEVFTSPESIEQTLSKELTTTFLIQMYGRLVQNSSYVERMRQLIDNLTPPLLGPSPGPPTTLAGCLLSMLQRPLLLAAQVNDSFFNEVLMVEMCRHILCGDMSEPIKWFVLPALAQWTDFPFLPLLHTIATCQLPNTTTLLYSVLVLEKRLTSSNADMIREYLNVLAVLSCNFTNLAAINDQHEDEEEETEKDPLKISKEEVQMLKECEELINDNNVVQCLLYGVNLSGEMIFPMCQICHNLLMADKIAIYKYKVLSSLALRDNFLNDLWSTILNMKQTSLFGNAVPLLTVISRGKSLTSDDTRRIVPMLATFCSLFSLLARTLHDAEFYGDEDASSSTSGQKLKFSIATLVEMIVRIKEVALRLVELAFPESSLSVSDQYRNVIQSEPITAANTHMWNHLFKVNHSFLL